MTLTKVRTRNADRTRARILHAASEEFAARGLSGARLVRIARAAGVEQALIHHYFDGKKGLYRVVVDAALAPVRAGGLTILARPRERTPAEVEATFTEWLDLLVRFHEEHRALFSLFAHESAGERGASARTALQFVEGGLRPVFDGAVARMREWKRRGLIARDVDPVRLCLAIIAMTGQLSRDCALVESLAGSIDDRFREAHRQELVRTVLARLSVRERSTSKRRTKVGPP